MPYRRGSGAEVARPPGFHPPSYTHTSLPQVLPALAASIGVDLGGDMVGAGGGPGAGGGNVDQNHQRWIASGAVLRSGDGDVQPAPT